MTTKREYLHSKGLAKIGRGRLSREAKAELERVRAEGMTFSDDTQAKPIAPSAKEKAAAKRPVDESVTDEKPEAKVNQFAPHRRNWTDSDIEFEQPAGMVSFKTACVNCGYSVGNCRCSDPAVFGGPRFDVRCSRV